MGKQIVSPRLFVIFARRANEAVIFRRGPSAWHHVIRWDTLNDKFYHGAWIKGRIYPEKCDLSPDGILLLTFIHQGRKLRTDYTDSWSAISRTPWLDAIGLWPQGTTYGGGGRFIEDRKVILRHYPGNAHPKHPGQGLEVFFAGLKDLVPHHTSREEIENAEWSGRDQRGRLVYVHDGCLFCVDAKTGKQTCLADFNGLVPNPQPAPLNAAEPLPSKTSPSKHQKPVKGRR